MAEIYAFISVGGEIGVFKTLMLCVLTALIGGFIVRLQGLETLIKAQNNLRTGKMPMNEIFNGFCIVIAGALLLTPGFVTDITGFLLLFPPFRMFLQGILGKNIYFSSTHAQNHHETQREDIIEGDYEEVDKKATALDKNSKDS